jgi:RNA polymerase sigma-70 factor, ECF subfamily
MPPPPAPAAVPKQILCLMPLEPYLRWGDLLTQHFARDARILVIAEKRHQERRSELRRRRDESGLCSRERRKIHNLEGRRVGERRAAVGQTAPLRLPPEAASPGNQITFVVRGGISPRKHEDIDSARLVTRLQSGETTPFSELYNRYRHRVQCYVRSIVGRDGDCEDLTQDVFVRVFEAIGSYELRGIPVRAWLFKIAHHLAITSLQQRARQEAVDPRALGVRAEAALGAASVELPPESGALRQSLGQLPQGQQEVLALRYVVDLSGAATAAKLDRSHDAVRQLQHRALQTLRAELESPG